MPETSAHLCTDTAREPGPPPVLLDTEDVAPDARMAHWRERFAPIWGDIGIEPQRGAPFAARLRSVGLGDLRFNEAHFAGHRMVRRHRRRDEGFYALAFPTGGQAVTQLGDSTATLSPGNVYLLDNSVDGSLMPMPSYTTFNVQIPMRLIDRRWRQGGPVFSAPLDAPGGRARMLAAFARSLHEGLTHIDRTDAGFYERQLCDLVGFLLQGQGSLCSEDSSTVAAHRRNVLAFIDAHHADETLGPAAIAAGCGLSQRYLFRIMRTSGRTVMEHVRSTRLQHARRALENPLMTGLSVAEVGYRSGFASASEFSRSFKHEHGVPPTEYRRSVRPH